MKNRNPHVLLSSLCALGVLCGGATFSSAAEPKFEKRWLSGMFYSEGANAGDFNNDGKTDVVAGPFIYDGPEFTMKREFMEPKASDPLHYSTNFFEFSYDFNGDGWQDILVVGFPGAEALWYQNPGKSEGNTGYWTRHLAFAAVGNESPTLTQLVGDDTPELVFNTDRLGYATYDKANPTQPWTFHAISAKGDYQRFTHGLGVGDVNGDGRMDVLDRTGWWEQPESLAGDPEWKKHPFAFSKAGGAQMYVYDVDGDGDNDVITSLAAHGFGLAWYEQVKEGNEITFKQHLILSPNENEKIEGVQFAQLHALDLVDMDGDGVKDIVTGKRYWAHGPTGDTQPNAAPVLYYFKLTRDGGKAKFTPVPIDENSGVGTQIVAKDISGDGKPDIVVGNKKGQILFIQK
jgi:hypothetical protein